MLDLAIIGTLPSLGHHQPIGPFENLSLLLPSKDNLFLTHGLCFGEVRLITHKVQMIEEAPLPRFIEVVVMPQS